MADFSGGHRLLQASSSELSAPFGQFLLATCGLDPAAASACPSDQSAALLQALEGSSPLAAPLSQMCVYLAACLVGGEAAPAPLAAPSAETAARVVRALALRMRASPPAAAAVDALASAWALLHSSDPALRSPGQLCAEAEAALMPSLGHAAVDVPAWAWGVLATLGSLKFTPSMSPVRLQELLHASCRTDEGAASDDSEYVATLLPRLRGRQVIISAAELALRCHGTFSAHVTSVAAGLLEGLFTSPWPPKHATAEEVALASQLSTDGVLQLLVAALLHHAEGSPVAALAVARLLRRCSGASQHTALAVAEAGAVPALVRALTAHPEDFKLTGTTSATLADIARAGDAQRKEVLVLKGCTAVVRALAQWRSSEDGTAVSVAEALSRCLEALLSGESGTVRMAAVDAAIEAGAVAALVNACKQGHDALADYPVFAQRLVAQSESALRVLQSLLPDALSAAAVQRALALLLPSSASTEAEAILVAGAPYAALTRALTGSELGWAEEGAEEPMLGQCVADPGGAGRAQWVGAGVLQALEQALLTPPACSSAAATYHTAASLASLARSPHWAAATPATALHSPTAALGLAAAAGRWCLPAGLPRAWPLQRHTPEQLQQLLPVLRMALTALSLPTPGSTAPPLCSDSQCKAAIGWLVDSAAVIPTRGWPYRAIVLALCTYLGLVAQSTGERVAALGAMKAMAEAAAAAEASAAAAAQGGEEEGSAASEAAPSLLAEWTTLGVSEALVQAVGVAQRSSCAETLAAVCSVCAALCRWGVGGCDFFYAGAPTHGLLPPLLSALEAAPNSAAAAASVSTLLACSLEAPSSQQPGHIRAALQCNALPLLLRLAPTSHAAQLLLSTPAACAQALQIHAGQAALEAAVCTALAGLLSSGSAARGDCLPLGLLGSLAALVRAHCTAGAAAQAVLATAAAAAAGALEEMLRGEGLEAQQVREAAEGCGVVEALCCALREAVGEHPAPAYAPLAAGALELLLQQQLEQQQLSVRLTKEAIDGEAASSLSALSEQVGAAKQALRVLLATPSGACAVLRRYTAAAAPAAQVHSA